MLAGYNTNVPYKGTVYHVQTEDSGLRNPVIVTLLYRQGTILASKKVNYSHVAASPEYKGLVRELMKEQHRAMIRELIAGRHTSEGETPEDPMTGRIAPEQDQSPAAQQIDPKNQIARSLDDILLDYIIKRND
jgi:hypothetical protein